MSGRKATSPTATTPSTVIHPKYMPIKPWCKMSGMSPSTFYNLLKRGDLKAVKLGGRTLVDVDHGLAWMAALPSAQQPSKRAAQT